MLSQLDSIIYPDRCEVYEVVPSQRYVFAIYKNGSSSLMMCARDQKWRVLLNAQIRRLDSVDIILRSPRERFISGVNIFLQQIAQNHPELDADTVLWFTKNYLFLNRHFCPQFCWILNLARYLALDCKLNFYGMEELENIVDRDFKPDGFHAVPADFESRLGHIPDLDLYLRLDQALIQSCMHQSLTFAQMIERARSFDPAAYHSVVSRSLGILEPLYVLSKT